MNQRNKDVLCTELLHHQRALLLRPSLHLPSCRLQADGRPLPRGRRWEGTNTVHLQSKPSSPGHLRRNMSFQYPIQDQLEISLWNITNVESKHGATLSLTHKQSEYEQKPISHSFSKTTECSTQEWGCEWGASLKRLVALHSRPLTFSIVLILHLRELLCYWHTNLTNVK